MGSVTSCFSGGLYDVDLHHFGWGEGTFGGPILSWDLTMVRSIGCSLLDDLFPKVCTFNKNGPNQYDQIGRFFGLWAPF